MRRKSAAFTANHAENRHPFDDGNGRIARAVGDLFLARADGGPERFYSLSAQIQRERKTYYEALERTQRDSLEVTGWLSWFLGALGRAIASAQATLDAVLFKARFWHRWAGVPMNERQLTSSPASLARPASRERQGIPTALREGIEPYPSRFGGFLLLAA